jgi:hypothetical protein
MRSSLPDHPVGIWWENIRPACRYQAKRTVWAPDHKLALSSPALFCSNADRDLALKRMKRVDYPKALLICGIGCSLQSSPSY